jgi:hypothetical protein
MGQRTTALADQFDAAAAEFAAALREIPDDKWNAVCDAEGWTVAQTAEHVAGQFPLEMEYITAAAEGRPLPAYSWDDINAKNDGRAARNNGMSRDDVLKLLHDGAKPASDYIRGLDDAQLDLTGKLALANGAEVTTEQLILGGVLIDHVQGAHLQSVRSA